MAKITFLGLVDDNDEIYKRGWKIFIGLPRTKRKEDKNGKDNSKRTIKSRQQDAIKYFFNRTCDGIPTSKKKDN